MARPPRSLDEVTRSIEQSLIPQEEGDPQERSPGASDNPAEPAKNSQSPRSEAARPLSEVYNKAADEIQNTGETVVRVANDIAAQTRELADLLRTHGASIAQRIEDFTSMTQRVAEAVQKGRGEVSSGTTSGPPFIPRS
jgi:hypothetical protein